MKANLLRAWALACALLSAAAVSSCDRATDAADPAPSAEAAESGSADLARAGRLGRILRTPESAFANLENFPFAPRYRVVSPGGLRMHYVDEGPRNGQVVLLLHGNPSWAYNYRKMIPALTAAGYRVIAPDLIGFGRSDKPEQRSAHTYNNQVQWMSSFVRSLGVRNITLYCQDWGGLIGLRVAAENEWLFARIVASNTALPRGDVPASPALLQWITQISPVVPLYSLILEAQTFVDLTPGERAAYDAPYPGEEYKAGPRQLPQIIPLTPDAPGVAENIRAWQVLDRWTKPFLTAYSEVDEISPDADLEFQQRVPGAKGQPHVRYPNTRHFIQDDVPTELSTLIIKFIRDNPVRR